MSYDMWCEGDHEFPERSAELAPGFVVTLVDTSTFPLAHVKFNNWTFGRIVDGMWEYDALDKTRHPKMSQAALSYSGETGLIPVDKFSDQSGWLVSQDEAAATYAVLVNQPIPETLIQAADGDTDWAKVIWAEWLTFLEHTGEHGGFSVR